MLDLKYYQECKKNYFISFFAFVWFVASWSHDMSTVCGGWSDKNILAQLEVAARVLTVGVGSKHQVPKFLGPEENSRWRESQWGE